MHASIAELLWTIVALVGAAFRLRGLIEAQRDVDAGDVLRAGRGVALLTRARRRDEAVHLAVKLSFAAIGVWAMTQPDPPHPTTGELFLTAVFIGAVALLVVNSALQDRERVELRRYVARLPQHPPAP